MTEILNTSEAIFRVLRDSKISYPEKVIIATRVWNSTDICFLNKVGFLSEWVCSTLIKSTGFSEARLGETPYLNLSYWKLFKDALEKTSDSSIPSPLYKLPLIPIFSSVVDYISSLESINNYDTDVLIENLLETVDVCFQKLSTKKSTTFRPPIDQIVTLTLNACNLIMTINTSYDNYEMNIEYKQSKIVFLRFELFSKVISFLESSLVKSSNPKKAYNVLNGKMFNKLLHVRSFVFHLQSSGQQEDSDYIIFSKIIKSIDNIFRHGLFQQDHIIEYATLPESNKDVSDKRNDGKGLINHHDQLFDKCREIINSNDDKKRYQLSGVSLITCPKILVLEVIPYWYGYFVEELRKHLEYTLGAAQSESVKAAIDKRRTLEFNFFSESWTLISEDLSKLKDLNHLKLVFSLHVDLLSKVSQYNVYQIKSDEISSRQLEFLQKVADFLIFEANNIQGSLMLQQPYTESCLTLGKTLLATYSKSHEMDFYIKSFWSALNDIPDDANIILKNPLFSREHLDEFANKITNYMTMTQACELINLFTTELCETYLSNFLDQKTDMKTQNKRRKLEDKGVTPLPKTNQLEPRIIFIIRFLRALRITSVSRDEIEKTFQSLFDLFIFPVLSTKLNDKNEYNRDIMIYAALNLHYCLVDISPLYWEKTVTPEFTSVLDGVSSIDPKVNLFLNMVRLQYVYRSIPTIKLQNTTSEELKNDADRIHKYISIVLSTLDYPKNAEISWTGYLVDMTKENFAISNSMLIIREWLDVVVNNCQIQELESIMRFIVKGFVTYSMGINNGEISMENIYIQVLHSAEFFELKPLRDIFLKVYLEELSSVFKKVCDENMIESDDDSKEMDMIIEIVSKWHQQTSSVMLDSIFLCFSSSSNKQSWSNNFLTDESIQKIHRLVTLLHLFPLEYFDRWEVNCLSALILLVDKVILLSQSQQSDITMNLLKSAILCRGLIRKFFLATTKQDDLLRKNQSYVMWWISSIYTCKNHIKTTSEFQQEGIDKQFINLVQITNETIIIMTSHMFARYRENENFKIVDYLNIIISTYSVHLDRSFDQEYLIFDLVTSDIWKFISDFLKLGIEFSESRKSIHVTRDQGIHEAFGTLQQKVEKSSLKFITFYLDESLQKLQKVDNFMGIQVILRQITYLEEVLKAYLMSLKYYNLNSIQQQNVNAQASINTVCQDKSLYDKETMKKCETIMLIVMDFIPIIELKINLQTFHKFISFIWETMSILCDKGAQGQSSSELDSGFGIFISKLSIEKYEEFSNNIINRLEELPFSTQKSSMNKDLKFLIHLVDIFLRSSTHEQLCCLQRKLSNILARLCNLGEIIDQPQNAICILTILSFLVSRRVFSFRSIDIGLILSTVISLTSSKTNFETDEKGYQNLFEEVCHLLLKILIHCREILYSTLPAYIIIIQSMFHCFKSLEGIKQKSELQSRRYVTIWDIRLKNPLPISSANLFTRLLSMISQKDSLNKSYKKKVISTRPFIKHVPCLIAEYLKVQTEGFLEPAIKESLRPGVYALLDLCDKRERDMIMVTLDYAGKSLLKTLWTEYNKDWKYVGRG
ncbi:14477_t:CDS:10 [Cetraspora pellucida]|uniref:14477_t:CDS:1 n=1 Tax=Cetraspora pellucida TaxID=1433469 RepID=A0A9N9A4C3_9GLOM|nr:14477_t:CDS:10 [Cetraspora pellucida]